MAKPSKKSSPRSHHRRLSSLPRTEAGFEKSDVVVLRLGVEGVVLQAQPTVNHDDLWSALSDLQRKISARLEEADIDLAVRPEVRIKIQEDGAVTPDRMG